MRENFQKRNEKGNVYIPDVSPCVNLNFCKDFSRFCCIFYRKKVPGGNMTRQHGLIKIVGQKNPEKIVLFVTKFSIKIMKEALLVVIAIVVQENYILVKLVQYVFQNF